MKIYGVQHDIVWEAKQENFDRVLELLQGANIEPGSIIVLPEMFATGYSLKVKKIGEEDGGETEQFLSELAHGPQ
jgi:predicted amidohydrolase